MKADRVFLLIRVVESEGFRLAARTSAHAHIAEVRDDVVSPEYFVCDTVELLQADGAAAAISILTDFTGTDLYLSLVSIEGVSAGISTPRMMTHEDEHFPLHPLNEHETLFRVMGLSLDTLESWDGDTICLETDKELADLLKPPPHQETVEDRVFTDSLDKNQAISTVDRERSSAAIRGRQERVGEDSSKDILAAVQLPLGGGVDEHASGEGEKVMPFDAKTSTQHMHKYFDNVKPREFLEDMQRWSPGYVKYMGWEDLYDKETGEVADFVPNEWKKEKSSS